MLGSHRRPRLLKRLSDTSNKSRTRRGCSHCSAVEYLSRYLQTYQLPGVQGSAREATKTTLYSGGKPAVSFSALACSVSGLKYWRKSKQSGTTKFTSVSLPALSPVFWIAASTRNGSLGLTSGT